MNGLQEKYADWQIVLSMAPLIGKRVSPVRLSPVRELTITLTNNKDGSTDVGFRCRPILLMPSIDAITIPADIIAIPLADLSEVERGEIIKSLEYYEANHRPAKVRSSLALPTDRELLALTGQRGRS